MPTFSHSASFWFDAYFLCRGPYFMGHHQRPRIPESCMREIAGSSHLGPKKNMEARFFYMLWTFATGKGAGEVVEAQRFRIFSVAHSCLQRLGSSIGPVGATKRSTGKDRFCSKVNRATRAGWPWQRSQLEQEESPKWLIQQHA